MGGDEIQVEHGNWTRIHNGILERLAQAKLNGSEFRCLMFLFRQTYGFGKKEDRISLSQWAEGTGLDRRQMIRTLQGLVDKRFIYATGNGNNRPQTWGFNKYFEQWDLETSGEFTTSLTAKSSGESTISLNGTSGESTTSYDRTSGEFTTKTSGELTTHKRKKEKSSSKHLDPVNAAPSPPSKNAAAANHSPKESPPKNLVAEFVDEYQHIWGLLIASDYQTELVADWAGRVPLEAWSYGLKECAKSRKVGNWKYLETILARVEREGLSPPATLPPAWSSRLDFIVEAL